VTKQAVEEFKKLYLEHYGVTLTDADAFKKANSLLSLYKAVYSTSNMKKNISCENRRVV